MVEKKTELVPVSETRAELPPILVGRHTAAVEAQVRSFYLSVADIFERWVTRRSSKHTQRAYRQDVMDFVRFLGLRWPEESTRLFTVSVADVLAFRDQMLAESKAPKTINRRIASLSLFYKYLQGVASEFRLPITVPNPAHAQFIPRGSSDPRDETKALSATRARQLMGLPSGDTVFDYRDRAIIKFFLYSGARIGTACRLRVKDFHQDGDEATVTLHEKGDKHRRIGLHFAAAEAIAAYIAKAELTKGPLFRARLNSRSQKLGRSPIGAVTMYNLVQGYLVAAPLVDAGRRGDGRGRHRDEGQALHLHAAFASGDHGDAAPRCRGGHHQGQGAARPPARDHDADLRQATAEPQGRGVARRADLTGAPAPGHEMTAPVTKGVCPCETFTR